MILISAGHHEKAQGAKFHNGKRLFTEYELAVAWADNIEYILNHGGDKRCIRVPNGTLKEKVRFINAVPDKTIAVEIHFNSAQLWKDQNANGVIDDGEMVHVGRGSETLYYAGSKKGFKAAELMQDSLSQVFPPNRGAKEGWYHMNKAKGLDYFLLKTACISLIIEPEFIDNLDKLIKGMDTGCHAIANSLLEIEQELFNNER